MSHAANDIASRAFTAGCIPCMHSQPMSSACEANAAASAPRPARASPCDPAIRCARYSAQATP